jgi:hypothetical protein
MILAFNPYYLKPSFYSAVVGVGRSRIDEADEPTGQSYVD